MKTVEEVKELVAVKYENHPYESWVQELFSGFMTWDEAGEIRPGWVSKRNWPEPKTRDRPTVLADMKDRAARAWEAKSTKDIATMERLTVEIQGLAWFIDEEQVLGKVWKIKYDGDPSPKLAVLCREFTFDIPDDYEEAK